MPLKPPQNQKQRPRSEINLKQAIYYAKESFRHLGTFLADLVGLSLTSSTTINPVPLMESFRNQANTLLNLGIMTRNQWTTVNGIASSMMAGTDVTAGTSPGVVQDIGLRRAV